MSMNAAQEIMNDMLLMAFYCFLIVLFIIPCLCMIVFRIVCAIVKAIIKRVKG